jgi:DNA-binding NarL/FixJ family response regulator
MNSITVKPSEISLVIADDDEITRIGLRHALEAMSRFTSIKEVENGETLMAFLEKAPVDLVLLDIGMPGMDGITATRLIKERFPQVKVLILSYHDTSEKVSQALSAGADAYCVKNINVDKLRLAIDSVLEGAVWLDPLIARKVAAVMPHSRHQDASGNPVMVSSRMSKKLELTEREAEVLRLITQGKSNKEIGLALEISPYTVKTHIRNLTQKLGVEDRTQAAVKALQDGLI